MNTELQASLQALLPAAAYCDAPDDLAAHQSDWSKYNPQAPLCLLRPETTEQLSAILALCNEHRQPVVTQGGLTGLSGGATPLQGEIAISLSRMRGITELDSKGQTISARAGTPLEEIQQAADDAGFKLALDLGARGSCSIGGNLATNAGGNQVIKYGMAREQVLGLEAVRADGRVVRSMNRMLKNNAGYDLKQILIGSEGTLGVITECVLRLHPKPRAVQTALCACDSFDDVIAFLQRAQSRFGSVSSFEVMWQNYYAYATQKVEHTRCPLDTSHAFYVLVEVEGDGSEYAQEHLYAELSAALEDKLLTDVLLAQSKREADEFWAIRDAIAEILGMLAPLANFDIGVPIKHMEAFTQRVEQELQARYPGLSVLIFGHIGDGNLHLGASTGRPEDAAQIYSEVYRIGADYEATVTAEHGVGVQKKGFLPLCRSEEELAMMRELKRALDPNNILNPGRVVDLD